MKKFITKNNFFKIISIIFWLLVWQLFNNLTDEDLLLVSPVSVFFNILKMLNEKDFYISIINSFKNINLGFFLGAIIGIFLAYFSYNFTFLKILILPLIQFIKSIPVASITILTIIYLGGQNLSIFVSFLIVLPVFFINIYEGLINIDKQLLELCKIFKITKLKKFLYIYLSQVFPYFISACSLSLGLAWKSGTAAEVIGRSKNTIGENLNMSKVYFDTAGIFSWTIVIVLISFFCEKIFVAFLKKIMKRIERM